VIPEPAKQVAAPAPSPPPSKPAPKIVALEKKENKSTPESGGKRTTPRLRFSSKTDQVVSIKVDTRPTFDSSRLRAALSTLQGVVRGQALIASASYDEALLSQTTDFVSDTVRLQHASYTALGHHQNVVTLSNFFVEVVNMLESNGPRLEHEHAAVLRRTRVLLKEACDVAESCNQPGWLVRMAKGEAMGEEFSRVHSTALTLLRAGGLDSAPRASIDGKLRRLPEPRYPNLSKSIRNMLVSIGDGSMEAGLKRLRDDEEAQKEMAKVADVPIEAIQREAVLEPLFAGDAAKVIENGAARDAEFAKVFSDYVTTSVDSITADGFEKLMTHMGLLDAIDTYDRPSAARAALVAADGDYDGALNFDEFRAFYSRHSVTAARLHLRMAANLELEYQVREVFSGFTNFGASKAAPRGGNMTPRGGSMTPRGKSGNEAEVGLDCSRFAKLCRDCDLLAWGMTSQHVDVVFTASKPRTGRRLDFDHFLAALALVADRRGQNLDQVAKLVAKAHGPAYRCTKSDFVSLYDDPSKISGISSRGGPSTGPVNLDLSALVARVKDPAVLPKASGIKPNKIEPTKPQSPKLATGRRTNGSGPCTPGRGVSLQATEAKAAERAAALASPRGPHAVFGRTCTARAAEMALSRSNKKKKHGGAVTPTPAAAAPVPKPVMEPTYTASRQLFSEPAPKVEAALPEPVVEQPASPPQEVSEVAASIAEDDDASNGSASPIAVGTETAAPVFEDPFKPDCSVAMVSVSAVAMKSLGSLESGSLQEEDDEEAEQKEDLLEEKSEEEKQELVAVDFPISPKPESVVEVSSLARSDSTADMFAAMSVAGNTAEEE
jgi:hypothetical protein